MKLTDKNAKLFFMAFIAMAAVQIFVPAKMLYDAEEIIQTGKTYKMRIVPVDPIDIFRGKYLHLSYEASFVYFEPDSKLDFKQYDKVYAIFTADKNGFLKIEKISKKQPSADAIYIAAKIDSIFRNAHKEYCLYMLDKKAELPTDKKILQECKIQPKQTRVTIDYSFNKFYMNEYKAQIAEREVIKFLQTRDNSDKKEYPAYVQIKLKNGKVSVENLFVADKSIRDFVDSVIKRQADF